MTEDKSTTVAEDFEDDFEDSSDEFVNKADFQNRLVMVYPTGKWGTEIGENGKPYDWYMTTTVVLDDGPDGWQETVLDLDAKPSPKSRPNRIPSVAEFGPQVIEDYRWSTGGMSTRLKDKIPAKNGGKPKGLLGRIDAKAQKGKNAAWRPNPPTEADRAIALEPATTAIRLAAVKAIMVANADAEDAEAF